MSCRPTGWRPRSAVCALRPSFSSPCPARRPSTTATRPGRQGFEDPFNRRTYPWGAEDREILAFYRRLCEVRADSETLIRGELRFDTGENDALLRYERTLGRSRIIVLVNRSRQEVRTGVNALYALDLLTQKEFDCEDSSGIEITVPAETAYLLRCFGSAE